MYQDLKSFSVGRAQRGRSAITVQLWWLIQATLFGLSPQFMYGWRRLLLRVFGADIGKGVLIRPTARVTYPWKVSIGDYSWIGDNASLYSLDEIRIGSNVVISQSAYLCTGSHDYQIPSFDLVTQPIIVEDQAWVATDVFVYPGVTIGMGAIIAARSTVTADIEPLAICAGTPAKKIRIRAAVDADT